MYLGTVQLLVKKSFTRVIGEMTKEQKDLWEVVSGLDLYAPHEET